MGGRFSRRRKNEYDPNYPPYNDPYYQRYPPGGYSMPPGGYGMPPGGYSRRAPYPYGPGNDPYGGISGYGGYEPYDDYGYAYEPTESMEGYYGGRYDPGMFF